MPVWSIILICLSVAVICEVSAAVYMRHRDCKKISYMLDALEDGELNFRFVESNKFNRTLNRLRWIYERRRQSNEQESWEKLIRVLTHEIMNTVSPIASLSDALSRNANLPPEDQKMDVKAGLETISASSRDLIKFVETYRELSGVAKPLRKAVMLDNLIERVLHLTEQQCAEAGTQCSYHASTQDILVYIDEGQVSQIFVNIIKNAIQAGATHVSITAAIDSQDETRIQVANNGSMIDKDNREQIFVPFFTTKPNGSGIGLSLSRQIMTRHNGSISLLYSNPTQTVFELIFR